MSKERFLKLYAGGVTSILAFVVYAVLMYRYTQRDLLEVCVTYLCFIFLPTFFFPFIITEGFSDDTV